jgi:AcrR family transcriptional regulator
MGEDKVEGRSYSSPLRERQREATRRLIVEAVAGLVAEGEFQTFSVQDVADRAGVSYASVYRHFPTRESLLEGTYEWASEVMATGGSVRPARLEDLPDWIGQSLPRFEEHREVSQALLILMGALNLQPPSRHSRDDVVGALVRDDAPGLPARRTRQVAAILRFLAGSHAWATLRQRFGLDADETAEALRWALEVLVRDVRRGEDGDGSGQEAPVG